MANKFTCSFNAAEQLLIEGDLTQHSIIGKQKKYFISIFKDPINDIDLSAVNKIDTAGLAWLIALQEFAQQKQIKCSYSNAPQELVKLAKLSQVYTMLPWHKKD